MNLYKKAILPAGFKANGVSCGIKRKGRLDLALFYSSLPAVAACRFTANDIKAAPVILTKNHLDKSAAFQAIIANSGNANCFTGNRGLRDAQSITEGLADFLCLEKESILIASTGIIARKLPLLKIKKAIPLLVRGLCAEGINKAKKAILTTDTLAKEVTIKFKINKQEVTICGIAKGSGMIAPDMATMLCFILTDAKITLKALDKALGSCVQESFNCITVDGCMSTNDSVMVLANSAAENEPIDTRRHFSVFKKALSAVCRELAEMIVRDAEGATKFIRIKVCGAGSFNEARRAALYIANSSLFKTAMYGQNPNFGRIVSALGASRIGVKEKKIKIKSSPLHKRDISIEVHLGRGSSSALVCTSDLSPEYIKINAAYN
ncbi:MAG: bifunctional glutamate N-acetyltransferase/amino-acid acetyltransferase ArgJ [Candidatus Omnitrophota bacterium]